MKKEYLILIALIIGLCAYLGLKKEDRIHYELPVLAKVDTSDIDRLEINKNDRSIVFKKTGEAWTLTDQNFPADASFVNKMLDIVKGLELSALVSEAGDLVRYELDPPNAVHVTAFSKEDEKRRFSIGKTAPSFNHTFVMLDKDKRIFQADKSFRNDFDKSADEFRDKLVMEFDAKDIRKITLERSGKTLVLTSVEKKEKDKAPEPQWQLEDGTRADQTAASDLLSSLAHLQCQEYLDRAAAGALEKEAACKITLENKTVLSLHLFEQDEQEDMAGRASTSPYEFVLSSYKAKDILSYVDALLGLEDTKEGKSDKE